MTNAMPEPLVPPEVDLRGYEYMPYYGDRLRESDLNSRVTDAEYRAAHNLWWSSWKQVPAASLPNDDVILCRLADLGHGLKIWQRVKARAMHGFVLCSDGRYYHRVLAALALDAWELRLSASAKGKAGAGNRWAKHRHEKEMAQAPPNDATAIKNDSTGNATATENHSKRSEAKRTEANGQKAAAAGDASTEKPVAAALKNGLFYPEKLTSAERREAGKALNGNPRAQFMLDELAGVMAEGKAKKPIALLVSFVKLDRAGTMSYSHASKIQAARELAQVEAELAAAGKSDVLEHQ